MTFDSKTVDDAYLQAGGLTRDGLVTRVRSFAEHARTAARIKEERQWRINIKWFCGEPFWRVGKSGEMEWISPDDRKHYTFLDTVSPRVWTLIGHTTYPPKYEAKTSTSHDMEDVFRARATADAANHAANAANESKWFREAQLLNLVCGHSWAKIGWDPDAGPLMPDYGQTACPVCHGEGAIPGQDGLNPCPRCGAEGVIEADAGMAVDPVGEKPDGDVCLDVVPPWEILPDPEARDLFSIRGLVHMQDMSRAAAFARFGEEAGLSEEDMKASSSIGSTMEAALGTVLGSTWSGPTDRKYVQVQEFYELRSQKFPHGLYAVLIGGDLVKGGALPLRHNRIPYAPLRCLHRPGTIYPQSIVERLLPSAMAINDHFSNVHARAGWTTQVRLLAERGQGVEMSDVPGVMLYDKKRGQEMPKPLDFGPGGEDAMNVIDRLTGHSDEVSFAAGVLQGKAETESARHDALLEERANLPLKMMVEDNAQTLYQVGVLLLETMKLFYPDNRIIQCFGPNGITEARAYKLSQLGGGDDMILSAIKDLGRSLASRRAEVMEMAKAGVFQDPRLMKLAEIGGDGVLYADRKRHESIATRENAMSRADRPMPQPMPFQDHAVHLETHGQLYDEYQMTFGPEHPKTQEVLQHMFATEQMQAQEEMRKQQAMVQAQQAFGNVNAADPNAQPKQTVNAAQDAGMMPTEPAPAAGPGPAESQPALAQVDQRLQGAPQNV